MVFGLFGVNWVMPSSVVGLFACWQGHFGHLCNGVIWKIVPPCLMWCIWNERNNRCFEDSERAMPDMKLLFFRTLLEWFSVWRSHSFSLLDLLDFCNLGFTHVSVMTNYLLDFSAFVSFTKIFNDHFKFQRAKQFNCTDIIVLCHSKAFVLDLFSLVYSLCAWVSLFLISMKSYYLSKKKS